MIVIIIASLLLLQSCAGFELPSMGNMFGGSGFTEVYFKKDISMKINGQSFEGTAVVPYTGEYIIKIDTDFNFDLFTAASCHREIDAKNIHIDKKRKWFGTIDKKGVNFVYTPKDSLEGSLDSKYCPLILGIYHKDTGQEYWGFIDFKTNDESLPATLYCNGEVQKPIGVGICQSRVGLIQMVTFNEETEVFTDCGKFKQSGFGYHFATPFKECISLFVGKESNKIMRLTTFGYNRIKMEDYTVD